MLLAGIKGAAADAISQLLLQDTSKGYDPFRTVAFGMWSGTYCGGVLYFLYNRLFPYLFPLTAVGGAPHPQRIRNLAGMVAFDNFVSSPWFFIPSYYVLREFLRGFESDNYHLPPRSPAQVFVTALSTYRREFWVVMQESNP